MSGDELYKLPGEHVLDGILLPGQIPEDGIKRIPDLDLQGDVVVVSYPKTGTIWTKELVWLLLHEADTEAARNEFLHVRARFLEFFYQDSNKSGVDLIQEQSRPRVMHSHLRPRFFTNQLNGDTKFVIVIRNPKDALVSFYNFYQSNTVLGNFSGSWDDFFNLVKQKHLSYGDYFDWYLDWLPYRDRNNVHLICFEDMKENPDAELRKLAAFLATPLTEDEIRKVVEFSQFENMKKNEGVPGTLRTSFFRKGQVGDWTEHFSEEQSDFIDSRWCETLQKFGVPFKC